MKTLKATGRKSRCKCPICTQDNPANEDIRTLPKKSLLLLAKHLQRRAGEVLQHAEHLGRA